MNTKNDVEVIINGKQYTLSGYESVSIFRKLQIILMIRSLSSKNRMDIYDLILR